MNRVCVHPIFTLDTEQNQKRVEIMLEQCGILRKKMEEAIGETERTKIYFKLVERCQEKLKGLQEKLANSQNDLYSSEKIASELQKIFSQTIMKGIAHREEKKLIEEFLRACGVRKIVLPIGQPLTDLDYDYIGEPVLYQEVQAASLDGCILKVIEEAYVLDYLDDMEELSEAILPGRYMVGRYQ